MTRIGSARTVQIWVSLPVTRGESRGKKPVKYDKRRYMRRSRIEIMFGRLKD